MTHSRGAPPRKVAVKAAHTPFTIRYSSGYSAVFGGDGNRAYTNCNANRDSFTSCGSHSSDRVYANDTRFQDTFTGVERFTLKGMQAFDNAD
jgi:hypothetical protein